MAKTPRLPRLQIGSCLKKPLAGTPPAWIRSGDSLKEDEAIPRVNVLLAADVNNLDDDGKAMCTQVKTGDSTKVLSAWSTETAYVTSVDPLRAIYRSSGANWYMIVPNPKQ